MSKFKKKFGRRILAYILSGAMIMSNMTAFASEAPEDTGGEYIQEEVVEADDADVERVEEAEEAEKDEKVEETVASDQEEDIDADEADAATDEADKTDVSSEAQTSETKSSLSVDEEDAVDEVDATETDEEDEDVKAAATLTADMVKVGGKSVTADGKAEYTAVYNDAAVEPEVTIADCVQDTDFSVSYGNNNAAGTATITVTPVEASEKLTGDAVEITFEITAKQTSTAPSEKTETVTYTLDFNELCGGENPKTIPFTHDIFTVATSVKDSKPSIADNNEKKAYMAGGGVTYKNNSNRIISFKIKEDSTEVKAVNVSVSFAPGKAGRTIALVKEGSTLKTSSDKWDTTTIDSNVIFPKGSSDGLISVTGDQTAEFEIPENLYKENKAFGIAMGNSFYIYSVDVNVTVPATGEAIDLNSAIVTVTDVNDADSVTYTGDAVELKTTVTVNGEEVADKYYDVTYEREGSDGSYASTTDFTSAGKIRAKITAKANANAEGTKTSAAFEISKAELEVENRTINHAPADVGADGEYDIAALFADEPGADTLEYELDNTVQDYVEGNVITNPAIANGKLTYTVVSEKPENVTSAVLGIKITSKNYNDKTFTITVNMKEKTPVTVKLASKTHVYNGEVYGFEDDVEITDVTGDGVNKEEAIADLMDNLSYKYQAEDGEATSVEPTDAGTYKVTIELASASAYTLQSKETNATLTIDPKPLKLKAKDAEWDKLLKDAPESKTAAASDYTFEPVDEEESAGLITGDKMVTQPTIKYYRIYEDESSAEMTADNWKALENNDTVDIILSDADAGKNYEIAYEKGTLTTLVREVNTTMTVVPEVGASLVSKLTSGKTYDADTLVADNYFLITAAKSSTVVTDTNSKVTRLKLGGVGNQFNRSIGFKISKPAKVTLDVQTASGSGEIRTLVIAKLNDDSTVTKVGGDSSVGTRKTVDITLEEEGIYYIYGEGALNFFEISVSYDGVVIVKKASITPTITADDLEKLDGAKVYFTATGETDVEVTSGTAVELKEETAYTLAVKKNGAAVSTLSAKINGETTYTPAGDANVTITIEKIEDADITESGSTPESGGTTESESTSESGGTTESESTSESSETTESGNTPESGEITESGNTPESSETSESGGTTKPETRTEWGFRSGSSLMGKENGKLIQGSKDTFAGLEIDATAEGAKFDATRDDWAQTNTGTIIKVPVKGECEVTVTGYEGTKYTVDGIANTKDEETFQCKGTDGWVTIVINSDGYLGGIKVKASEEESSEVIPSESEEESEVEDSKITADNNRDTIIPVNSSKIKVEAANLVEAKKPQYAVTVTYTYTDKDGKTYQQQLTEGEHYTVALVKGFDGITVGPQKVTISGTGVKTDLGTFTSQKTVSYNIEGKKAVDKNKNIAKLKLALNKNEVKNAVYTGSYITPSVDGLSNVDEANYKLVYKNNVNVGKASVTIIGQGEYYGTKVLTFSIKKADISKVTPIASNVDFTGSGKAYTAAAKQNKADALEYKGKAITFQSLALTYGNVKLNPRTDYTIDYKKNAQAGTATATIKGINNYSGSIKITYAITANSGIASSLEKFTEANPASAEFSSKGARLTSMVVNGITLKENTDYKVKYGKDCATAAVNDVLTVTVTGAGSYKNAFKDAPVAIKVVPGEYHIKDGTVADKAKATDKTKLISAAKITDAAGAKVKPADVEIDMENGVTTTSITVSPAAANAANYVKTVIPCRVATKLSSVKQDKNNIEKVFDGVNTVTLTEKEIAEHLPNVEANDIRVLSYKNNNKIGAATVTIEGRPASAYYGKTNVKFKIVAKKTELGTDADEAPDVVDTGKLIDVWDFAAGATALDDNGVPTEYLSAAKYNNMLTEDLINSWYDGVEAGSTGVEIGSFQVKDEKGEVIFEFNGNGKVNNRIRTKNTKITRKDEKSLKDADGNEYLGYVYSNSSSQPNVYVGIKLDAGDIVTAVVGSNGGDSLIKFEPVDGSGTAQEYQYKSGNAGIATFYAAQAGEYKIYSVDEKLVVARVMVEKTDLATVSGSVTAPESLKDYAISFTCKETGAVKTATVADGKYTIDLNEGYTYDVALTNANGYIVTNENTSFVLQTGLGTFNYDVTIASVDLITVNGSIKGLDAVAGGNQKPIEKMKLAFASSNIYVPEFTLSSETGEFTLVLEKDVEYTVTADGVDDFTLKTAKISASADGAQDITFEAKPVYDVTISPEGVTVPELADTVFTFSRVYVEDNVKAYEEDYVYTFTGAEGIKLRDGQYEIKAEGPYTQTLTSDLKVNGAAVTKVVKFNKDPITLWDFADESFTDVTDFKGLLMSGVQKNKTYALGSASGEYKVPVAGPCTVAASYCYRAAGTIEDSVEISLVEGVDEAYGSTSKEKSSSYTYTGEGGYVTIKTTAQTYMTKIEVAYALDKAEYKEKITVGAAGCDYTTINDAFDAVRNMDRTSEQRVTIEIQPGDYEEMLVVDTPNVTLKNANASPSIVPVNKGVDLDASSVRITSYYGHGYAYYSMGADCKWNADLLAANKENGCLSFTNPGTGTTSGSYWNATVVVDADGFEADGIIFENSFNQYVSKKAADDVIVPLSGAKEGTTPRASMSAGDTTVQDKKYVERAAALAIKDAKKKISFNNCSFIGRQDTLYGGTNVTAAFYDCDVYGGTDYIFGPMTAVFAKCDLVFNTMEDGNDVGYITASQTKSGRGYLMYNCQVTSTTPGVNTASQKTSKPGYLGRPWEANTGEALFYKTIIGKTDFNGSEESLIVPEAWNAGLGGKSALSQEYASIELATGVDNSAKRVDWSNVLTADAEGNVTLADGNTKVTDATVVAAFLGEWNPFEGKDMTISNGQ